MRVLYGAVLEPPEMKASERRPYAKNLFRGHFETVSDAGPIDEIASGLRSRSDKASQPRKCDLMANGY